MAELRAKHLGSFAHLLHIGAREVDGLRFLDFVSYVLWIEQYAAQMEELDRKANANDA